MAGLPVEARLTLADAATLSGFEPIFLETAIREGRLEARGPDEARRVSVEALLRLARAHGAGGAAA